MRQLPCLRSFPVLKLRLRYRLSENLPGQGCRLQQAQSLTQQLMCPQLGTVVMHFPQAWEIPGCPQWEVALDFVEAPTHP